MCLFIKLEHKYLGYFSFKNISVFLDEDKKTDNNPFKSIEFMCFGSPGQNRPETW